MKISGAAQLPIAIAGAGFSGTLLAANLMPLGVNVVLVERDERQIANGLAFGTRRPEHLLNVRASNMSVFPDDLGHFLRWMGSTGKDEANRFVPRLAYGHYLRELLVDAMAASPDRARIVQGEAVASSFVTDSITLALKGGKSITCRALVLALGNSPPSPMPLLAGLPKHLYAPDPWSPAASDGVDKLEQIALLGSSLTAADVIVSLEAAGFRGRVTALSRRGLKPRAHAEVGPVVSPPSRPEARGSWLVHAVRERAASAGWCAAIDELRPHTQHLWRGHDLSAQRRFLRHLRPYWDVHRHRLAPAVARHIDDLENAGRVRFTAGKLLGTEAEGKRVRLAWRPRGAVDAQSMTVDRVINCTGPEGALDRADYPLPCDLVRQGRLRADPHELGLDVDRTGHAFDVKGRAQERLFAVGLITKGEAWETVAVPDIRRQVWDLGRYLGHAHWVGGEGL